MLDLYYLILSLKKITNGGYGEIIMKITIFVIKFMGFIYWFSLILPGIALIIWILTEYNVFYSNVNGFVFLLVSFLCVFIIQILHHSVSKCNAYLSHEKMYILYISERKPYICKHITKQDAIFFNSFSKSLSNKYKLYEFKEFKKCYLFENNNSIKGFGFIDFSLIQNFTKSDLDNYLYGILQQLNRIGKKRINFLICVISDNPNDDIIYRFIKYQGLNIDRIPGVSNDYFNKLSFCLINKNNQRVYFYNRVLAKDGTKRDIFKMIKKYLLY